MLFNTPFTLITHFILHTFLQILDQGMKSKSLQGKIIHLIPWLLQETNNNSPASAYILADLGTQCRVHSTIDCVRSRPSHTLQPNDWSYRAPLLTRPNIFLIRLTINDGNVSFYRKSQTYQEIRIFTFGWGLNTMSCF